MHDPPHDTRAYFRGRCLEKFADAVAAASWDSVIFDLPGRESLQRVPTIDPLRGSRAHVGDLLDRCSTASELFARSRPADGPGGRRLQGRSMAQEQKQPRKSHGDRGVGRDRPGDRRRRAQGGARRRRRRHPRRDRRRAGVQRRGLREVVHPEGRPVSGGDPRLPAALPAARLVVLRRLPGRPVARPAARTTHAAGGPGPRPGAARHHDRGGDVPRRRGAWPVTGVPRWATSSPQRDIEKVFPADEFSAAGIAGTAGLAVELVRLFQTELEHYEKIEGIRLSLDGKANRLSALIRGNLGDGHAGPRGGAPLRRVRRRRGGRVASSATTSPAGATRRPRYHAVGSGSLFARGALKKLYRPDLGEDDVIDPGRAGALRRRRRRFRHRGARPRATDLPDGAP